MKINEIVDKYTQTKAYYDRNVDDYIQNTQNLDISNLRNKFLRLIPKGGKILDAGCGPGRDLKLFKAFGYNPTGVDLSKGMVDRARKVCDCPVYQQSLTNLNIDEKFDGIWAMASLLHIKRNEIPKVLKSFYKLLNPQGILFTSIKEGKGERVDKKGRFYTDFGLEEMENYISQAGFTIKEGFYTGDERGVTWINIIARK